MKKAICISSLLLFGLLFFSIICPAEEGNEQSDIMGWVDLTIRTTNLALRIATIMITFLAFMLTVLGVLGFREYFVSRRITQDIRRDFDKLEAERKSLKQETELHFRLISAKVFYSQDQYDDAMSALDRIPDNFSYEVLLYRGMMQDANGDHIDAHTSFKKALQFPDCDKPRIHYNEGKCFFRQGLYDEAIEEYDKTTRLDYNYLDAYNNKAVALRHKGNLAEAIKVLAKIMKMDKAYTAAPYNIACYYALQRKIKKATKYLEISIDGERTSKAKRDAIDYALKDPDFAIIREKRNFKQLLEKKTKELEEKARKIQENT